jgi:multidrug efflux system outer membrane protein
MNRLYLITLCLLLAAACTSPPPVEYPSLEMPVPDQWTGGPTDDGALDSDWWTVFDDPALTNAVTLALARNYDLRAAAARVEQAAAQARIAGADLKPTLGMNLSGTRRRQNFAGLPFAGGGDDPLSTTTNSFGVSLDASWELDLWGRLRSGEEAALAEYQAVEMDLHGAYLSLAGQTVKAWFAIAEAFQQVQLAEDTVKSFAYNESQVRRRYETGLRPSVDLRLSASQLADARANLENQRQQLDSAIRQLEILQGHYPDKDLSIPVDLPGMPEAVPAGLPAELVSRRPDLAAAERRLAASGARLSMAEASLYPRLALTASGGTSSDEFNDLMDGDFRVWSLAANLTQPIFEGDRLRSGVDLAKAREEESLATYTSQVLAAFSEVESTLAAEQFLADREIHLTEATTQSIAARTLSEDRYRAGLDTYLLVLESQRRALLNESALLTVRRLRLENRVNLYLALGGGFHMPEPSREEE